MCLCYDKNIQNRKSCFLHTLTILYMQCVVETARSSSLSVAQGVMSVPSQGPGGHIQWTSPLWKVRNKSERHRLPAWRRRWPPLVSVSLGAAQESPLAQGCSCDMVSSCVCQAKGEMGARGEVGWAPGRLRPGCWKVERSSACCTATSVSE